MSKPQPIPFEIFDQGGTKVMSNGTVRLAVMDPAGKMFKRRAISGISMKNATDSVLPHLNALAGEILANPAMPMQAVINRLLTLAGSVNSPEPQHHEWAVAKLDDVYVYTDGTTILVTKTEMTPGG